MSSPDSKPPSDTRLRRNWYLRSGRAVLTSSACVAVLAICVSGISSAGADDVLSTDDRTISPDAMQRARDVKNLPILKIVDMTLVFPSE
jgi:hypothetical protein